MGSELPVFAFMGTILFMFASISERSMITAATPKKASFLLASPVSVTFALRRIVGMKSQEVIDETNDRNDP